MLFINPIGGKKKGIKIWEKDVQPLMTIAGIETKMMITERAGHIRDALLTADLSDLHVSPVLETNILLLSSWSANPNAPTRQINASLKPEKSLFRRRSTIFTNLNFYYYFRLEYLSIY